ncbi:MAG: FAD-dependent monooxygenase [Pseudonocardiaceae bacterium]
MTPSAKTSTEYDASGDLEGMHRSVVVIGGGQAGLSMSYCLTQHGVDHVVLKRDLTASATNGVTGDGIRSAW